MLSAGLELMFSPLVDSLVTLAILFALPFVCLWWQAKRREKLEPQIESEWRKAEQEAIERKAEAVAECLLELGMPQLEEKTKRLEIARRLCIAIFAY